MLAGLRAGGRGAVVMRAVDNPFLDAALRAVRLGRAQRWIDKRGAVAAALEELRRGESIALLLDENAGYRGIFVDFFGRPASTSRTAALLALRTGAPIIVGAALRQVGSTQLRFELAQIEPISEGSDPVRALTQSIVNALEDWIRSNPTQWRWMHWRWKTRPGGREETYGRSDLAACFREADPRSIEQPSSAV
jgi:KDO2-lipid IV(A) lauroyltransferase